MADSATLTRQEAKRTESCGLNAKLANEVEAVLEAPEWSRQVGEPGTGRWYFRVPQAGVKFYSFQPVG